MSNHGNRSVRRVECVRKRLRRLFSVDNNALAAPAAYALDLGMPLLAENDDEASGAAFLVDDAVDFVHERAGRVENLAVFRAEGIIDRARHAVRPNEHPLAVRYLLDGVRGVHAHLFEPLDFVHIVDDLAVGIDAAVLVRLLLGELDRPAHAEAEAGGLCYRNAHACSFSA